MIDDIPSIRVVRLLLSCVVALTIAPLAHAGSFEDALATAYTNNPRIKAERQRLEAIDEGVAEAASGFRPTIDAVYNRGRQSTSFNGAADVTGTATTRALRATQPLFRGGGTLAAYDAAKERVKAGQNDLSALEQRVMFDSASAYMNVVEASALLELARSNAQVLSEQLAAANTRFAVGEVTRTDVAQSEARQANAAAEVIRNEGNLLSALATYQRVIGVKPEGVLNVPETLPELPATLEDALSRARAANPQLLAALAQAKAADYDVRGRQAVLLPRVNLVGSLNRQTGTGAAGTSDFDQDRVGIEVAIPLYQSGSEYAAIRQAKSTARQRAHESIDRRMGVDEATTQSWEQLESAIASISIRNAEIKAASLALEGVKQEQQFGARTLLDVLDAEQELFTARSNLVRAQRDRIVAAYNLAFILGQMTPAHLKLNVATYDPKIHADEVGLQTIGY